MKMAKWMAFGLAILSGMIYLVGDLVPQAFGGVSLREASSVSIIGGVDGPTAVYVAKSEMQGLVLPAIFVVSLLAWLFFRWKSKKLG